MLNPADLLRLFELPAAWEWRGFGLLLLGLVTVIGISELIRHKAGWSPEVTRKFVHISVGVLVFFSPALFDKAMLPMLLALLFVAVDGIAVRAGLLVGMHGTTRTSYGTVYYPLAFLVLIILFWYRYPPLLSISMLGLAFGDAAAAIVGESLRAPHEYRLTSDKKSIEGSVTMLVVTFGSLVAGIWYFDLHLLYGVRFALLAAAVGALIATAWEALSSKGFDNFTIPLSIAFVMAYFFVPTEMQDIERFLVGIVLGSVIAYASLRFGFLTPSGSVSTFLLAVLVYGLGGWKWTLPLLTFFVLSSILSKLGKAKKDFLEGILQKSGARDEAQVAANGAVAGAIILAQLLFQEVDLYPAFVASVAAVTADTWGTEIGVWVRGRTMTLPFFRRVEPGANGGISVAGFLAGIAGSTVVALTTHPWMSDLRLVWMVAIAGVAGALIDSIAGATVQAGQRCAVCGKLTERREHCGSQTDFVKGIRWIDNDVVNWTCAATGALVALLVV